MAKSLNDSELNKLYTTKQINLSKEPLFFGSGRNTQRFDVLKYPFFDTNNDKQQSLFWRPQEVSLNTDRQHFDKILKSHEKGIVTKTIQRLIFLDSLQGRSPLLTFGQITTLPEFENILGTWQFFEGSIHSRSYSYLLQNVYSKPDEVFDGSFKIPLLMKHADSITSYYNELYGLVIDYQYYLRHNKKIESSFMKEIRTLIILAFINVNILEGIRFYSGFASVWAITEGQGYIPGISKILRLICRDENQHLAFTQRTLNILKKQKEEGFTNIYAKLEKDKIFSMYENAYNEEVAWSDFLYEDGSVLGLNSELMKNYLKFMTNKRLRGIGMSNMFDNTSDPLPWMNNWIQESVVETAPQELESSDYQMAGLDLDNELDRSKIDLKKLFE
jgi:ribonucleoside-diphosphate reductase beta chain